MKDTGSVERILVGGILVVVLAILGIASWSATGSDDGSPGSAADGGVDAGGAHPVARAGDAAPASVRAVDERQREQAAKRRELAGRFVGKDLTSSPANENTNAGSLPSSGAGSSGAGSTSGAGRPQTIPVDGTSPVASSADPRDGTDSSRSGMGGAAVPLSRNGKTRDAGAQAGDGDGRIGNESAGDMSAGNGGPSLATGGRDGTKGKPAAGNRSYVIREGDNLWKIARQSYGDGNVQKMVDAIVAANPALDPDSIFPGQSLVLPDLSAEPGVITPTPQQIVSRTDGRFYEVADGDTLSTIAQAQLGTRARWEEIYELNRKRIPNPDVLHPGMTLILPRN